MEWQLVNKEIKPDLFFNVDRLRSTAVEDIYAVGHV